jgi:hypothetical protein
MDTERWLDNCPFCGQSPLHATVTQQGRVWQDLSGPNEQGSYDVEKHGHYFYLDCPCGKSYEYRMVG